MPVLNRSITTRLVDIDEVKNLSPEILAEIIASEERGNRAGRVAGLILIIAGIVLLFVGTSGSIGFEFKIPGVSASLSNAGPGALCVVVGVVLMIASRSVIRIKSKR